MDQCDQCQNEASGHYSYTLPGGERTEEPLCRRCASRFRSLNVVDIKRRDETLQDQ
jgi:hypothetical protein